MRVIRTCAAAIVALVVIAGCASTTAQPGYICTDAAGEYIRCTKESQDAQRAARLQAEATQVYRRFWAEYMRLIREGGAPEATDELRATTTEHVLESVGIHLRRQYESQVTAVIFKESLTIRVSSESVPGSLVALAGCEDTSGSLFRNPQGETVGTGGQRGTTRFFKQEGGQLKIFDVAERETCES